MAVINARVHTNLFSLFASPWVLKCTYVEEEYDET